MLIIRLIYEYHEQHLPPSHLIIGKIDRFEIMEDFPHDLERIRFFQSHDFSTYRAEWNAHVSYHSVTDTYLVWQYMHLVCYSPKTKDQNQYFNPVICQILAFVAKRGQGTLEKFPS